MEKNDEPEFLVLYTFKNIKDYRETKKNIENFLNLRPAECDRKKIRSFEGVKSTGEEGINLTIGVGKMGISGGSYKEIDFFRKEVTNEKASLIEEKIKLDRGGIFKERA